MDTEELKMITSLRVRRDDLKLLEIYIRWKTFKKMKAWNKLKNTHFYIDGNGEIKKVKVQEDENDKHLYSRCWSTL